MVLGENEIKKFTVVFLVTVLLLLVFFIIKPVLFATLGGLILAYVFMPLFNKLNSLFKNRTLTASIVSLIVLLSLAIIVWFMTPIIIQQIFDVFTNTHKINFDKLIATLFPNSSDIFINQLSSTLSEFIGSASSTILNIFTGIFLNLPRILLNLGVLGFVFFFSLRDSDKLRNFFTGLSPFNEEEEKILVKHFKGMTDSVIYGQVIVGVAQGLLAGLGFLFFGIEKALVLTILAIFLSIIPFVGPALIWIPIAIYLFTSGNTGTGVVIAFVLYNILIVSTVDNLLRTYLISRKTEVSAAVIFVGMIGGLFFFGILGLIIGPLALAHLITLLESYRDKSIYSLFSSN